MTRTEKLRKFGNARRELLYIKRRLRPGTRAKRCTWFPGILARLTRAHARLE